MKRFGAMRSVVVTTLGLGVVLVAACSDSNNPAQLGGGPGVDSGQGDPCAVPNEGCSCNGEGVTAQCGEVTVRSGNYVTCSEGTRTCSAGKWGACVGDHTVFKSISPITNVGGGIHVLDYGVPVVCQSNPCDPACQSFPDNSNGVDAGPGLVPIDGGFTLGTSPAPDGSSCQGIQCQIVACADGGTTTITGKVYDPASLNPLFNVLVAVPAGAVPAISSGVPLPAGGCGGVTLPPVVTYAYSAYDGSFTLSGVPSGNNIPIIIQSGRWQRKVNVNVTACTNNNISANCGNGNTACLTRLPRVQSEGNIPKIALVAGSCDPMECLLYRVGVASSEFTDDNGTGRIHYYKSHGASLAGGANNHKNLLLGYDGLPGKVNNYDLVMLPCDCGNEYGNGHHDPNGRGNLINYTNQGGRLFSSHWGREWLERTSGSFPTGPYPNTANWYNDGNTPYGGFADPLVGHIDTSFQRGIDFSSWMNVVTGNGATFNISPSRFDLRTVIAPSKQFVFGFSDNNPGAHGNVQDTVADFTFDTPLGQPPASQLGRVMFTNMHLSVPSWNGGGSFPSECVAQGTALAPQEKAAEFLLFDLGSCVTPLPPPVILPWYNPATVSRVYQGVCPAGKHVVWRFFYWEDSIPATDAAMPPSIVFSVQTAATQAALASATVAPLATVTTTNLSFVGSDVGAALATIPAKSLDFLQVNMTLNPSSDNHTSPTLLAWQLTYDCSDSE